MKLGFIKALEGYRSIAIIAVLLFHLDISYAKGGFIGVDLFFVISGYIITKIYFMPLRKGHSHSASFI